MLNATYSPEDNRLRVRSTVRLAAEDAAKLKAAGYKWAPKQELWVAPMWTPEREDLAIELCGEIDDEDTSLVERAEERAERFEGYRDHRIADAEAAQKHVESISNGIPLGQPILVSHHSERRARKDAERIQNGMRKAVKAWQTAEYWTDRARGALRHAKYKELPRVRANRIKKLEAEERKHQREREQATKFLAAWTRVQNLVEAESEEAAKGLALKIANFDHVSVPVTIHGKPFTSSVWSELDGSKMTAAAAAELARNIHTRRIEWHDRWLVHLSNRLAYERAMLAGPIPEPEEPPTKSIPKLPVPAEIEAMKDVLKGRGVTVVTAPDLYPTPPELAKRVVALADVAGHLVLEPSAGTGSLADEIMARGAKQLACVEINAACCDVLRRKGHDVIHGDFLSIEVDVPVFDRIAMNPPFGDQRDIAHVLHAFEWLKPGGRLVAIMSAGTRFRSDLTAIRFRETVSEYGSMEDLPDGSFKAAGTDVRTVLVVLDKPVS